MFDESKRLCLQRSDRSRKGSLDEPIIPLLDAINSSRDFYTTSSCSGRIVLVDVSSGKLGSSFVFSSHSEVCASELDLRQGIWLRQESPILHVACRNLDAASRLVNAAKSCGFRRSGLTSVGSLVVEVGSADGVFLPLVSGLPDAFADLLVSEMNSNLRRGFAKIARLKGLFERGL